MPPPKHHLKSRKQIQREATFTLDGRFLRDEARDAIKSYFTPFSGLYAAVVGKEVRVVRERNPRTGEHNGRKRA